MTRRYKAWTWWCCLWHTAVRLACTQRWLHPDSVWQFPPGAGQFHPPGRSRKFLMCHHGNHPNTPITEKSTIRNGRSALTHFFSHYRFELLTHTVTSMLMMSPSWSGRLRKLKKNLGYIVYTRSHCFWVSGDAHTCRVCRDKPRCSQMCTLILGSHRIEAGMGTHCAWWSPGERWNQFHLLSCQPGESQVVTVSQGLCTCTNKHIGQGLPPTLRLRPASSRTCLASSHALARPSICSWSLISM